MLGVLAIGGYAFTVSYLSLRLFNHWYPLRVGPEAEQVGLNVAEHAASTEIIDLLTEMDNQRRRGDFSQAVVAEPHTEVGQITQQYNHVLERVNKEIHKREDLLRALTVSETRKSAILDAVLDCIITIDRRGVILEINPAATRTFGCSQRGAIGQNLAGSGPAAATNCSQRIRTAIPANRIRRDCGANSARESVGTVGSGTGNH
jgi:Amt family ammonium transporter